MKKFFFLALIMGLALVACEKNKDDDGSSQIEEGVQVSGGLIWATRNVGNPGKFVSNPEDYGGYFTQGEAQTACPEGWRLPTVPEFVTDHGELTTLSGVVGYWFGNVDHYYKGLFFLPAAGRRTSGGEVFEQGTDGWYWTSTGYYGYRLHFDSEWVGLGGSNDFGYSISVRCVKDPIKIE